jgi:hypothetical protein
MKGSFSKAIAALFGLHAEEEYGIPQPMTGMDENYLFDFMNYAEGRGIAMNAAPTPIAAFGPTQYENGNPKIQVTPKSVLSELETVPNPISLSGIADKIQILKAKRDMIRQHYSRREVEGLIERLQNRFKYAEHRKFFDTFPNTTDEKIEALITKHNLVHKTADLFIPEFPVQAVELMQAYEKECLAVSGKKPVFYVIATDDSFRKAYERRDPILLVQSPFGFYWQILGAWDEEMILLSEL